MIVDPAVATTRLANGLRVTTVALPHLHTANVALFVKVGSRFETPADSGLSHFVEHMLFRGTETTAERLAAISRVTRKDVIAAARRVLRPEVLVLATVGALSRSEISAVRRAISTWNIA